MNTLGMAACPNSRQRGITAYLAIVFGGVLAGLSDCDAQPVRDQ